MSEIWEYFGLTFALNRNDTHDTAVSGELGLIDNSTPKKFGPQKTRPPKNSVLPLRELGPTMWQGHDPGAWYEIVKNFSLS